MSKPGPTPKPKTQLQRAKAIVERYKKWRPILEEIRSDFEGVFMATDDSSIDERTWGQLAIVDARLGGALEALKKVNL